MKKPRLKYKALYAAAEAKRLEAESRLAHLRWYIEMLAPDGKKVAGWIGTPPPAQMVLPYRDWLSLAAYVLTITRTTGVQDPDSFLESGRAQLFWQGVPITWPQEGT